MGITVVLGTVESVKQILEYSEVSKLGTPLHSTTKPAPFFLLS